MAEQRTVHTTEAEYLATLETLERLRAERDCYREALERIARGGGLSTAAKIARGALGG